MLFIQRGIRPIMVDIRQEFDVSIAVAASLVAALILYFCVIEVEDSGLLAMNWCTFCDVSLDRLLTLYLS
jgi:hypothetical protein